MRNLNWLVLTLFVGMFVTGCIGDQEIAPFEKNENNRLRLWIPEAKDVQVYSTATPNENRIEDCFVVVFTNSGVYKNGEKIDISRITGNGMASSLLPQLSFNLVNGDRIYVICNTGLTSLPVGITAESDIDVMFKPAKDYYWEGEALPMSGYSSSYDVLSSTIEMIRCVAKVQVKLGESFNIGGKENIPEWNNFVATFDESLCGFVMANYAGKSNIMPPMSGFSQNLSGLSAFYGATSENKFIRFIQHAGNNDLATIYISEYANSTKDCEGNTIADNVFNQKRQFLLMVDKVSSSALLGNGTIVPNAWRLDFYDAKNEKYLDIKRNHHYIFTINKIRSMPYRYDVSSYNVSNAFAVDQQVWHNSGSNIEYTVVVSEDWALKNYSNGQYALSLSADTLNDETMTLRLKAQVPVGVDAGQITTHVILAYDSNDLPIGQPGDNLEISGCINRNTGVSFLADGTVTTLTFKVNNYQDLDGAYLHVYLGNIYKKILLSFNPWVYMPDQGFRSYCLEKGYISEIKASDNNYVKISSAGRAATTINLNRTGYYATVYGGYNLRVGGIALLDGDGFYRVPSIVSTANMSDVNTALWTPVYDLTGIEAFANLENLYANGNNLTALDVSANKKLKRLDAESNPMTSITFDNPDLVYVDLLNSHLLSINENDCSPGLNVFMVTGHSSLTRIPGTHMLSGQSYNGINVWVLNSYYSTLGSLTI